MLKKLMTRLVVTAAISMTPFAAKAYFIIDDDARYGSVVSDGASLRGTWMLHGGVAVHTQLEDWARVAGWTLEWKVPVSWIVPASVSFGDARFTPFADAVARVIENLSQEGKPVRVRLWEGNRVAEVIGTDVR